MVRIPEKDPYQARHDDYAQETKWPFKGQSLPVMVDPKHTDKIEIVWDEVPEGGNRATQAPSLADALKTALAARAGLGTDPTATLRELGGNTEALAQLTPFLQRIEQVTGRDLTSRVEQAIEVATSVAAGEGTIPVVPLTIARPAPPTMSGSAKRSKPAPQAEPHVTGLRFRPMAPLAPMPPTAPMGEVRMSPVPASEPMAALPHSRVLN